jgi:hypothetical protein
MAPKNWMPRRNLPTSGGKRIVSCRIAIARSKRNAHADVFGVPEFTAFHPIARSTVVENLRVVVDAGITHPKRLEDVERRKAS